MHFSVEESEGDEEKTLVKAKGYALLPTDQPGKYVNHGLDQGGPRLPVSWARLFSACGSRATRSHISAKKSSTDYLIQSGPRWPAGQRLDQPGLEQGFLTLILSFTP